ncbi:MAG: aminoacyl-tRNA hydrolase [Desulfamplus sp.]|nr:aminoacyl-tRNA hydrolase [Desulfamplus sp.]MBF0389695.1 aminoacyl-tRNA hydrolase [Desulfamplus sp.]
MADSQIYMVAGLGNPGKEYAKTRHNVGFIVVEELSYRHQLTFNSSKFDADIAKGNIKGNQTILVKPQSYMNRSGFPIQKISSYFKIETNNIVVVHDELDLPFGRIMVVKDRGHGGHNGIRSIIETLGTKNFIRIRVGVGRPIADTEDKCVVTGHVLGRFEADEQTMLDSIVKMSADACQFILSNGVQAAMNRFNTHAGQQ